MCIRDRLKLVLVQRLDSAPISAGYVAGWAKEADGAAIEAAAEHVAKTSHAIAEALQLTAQ